MEWEDRDSAGEAMGMGERATEWLRVGRMGTRRQALECYLH